MKTLEIQHIGLTEMNNVEMGEVNGGNSAPLCQKLHQYVDKICDWLASL